jgi:hypothetical protein
LNNFYSKEILVIPDAIEVPILSPKDSKTNRILWFGHPSNIKYLIDFIEKYKKTNVIFKLIILSDDKGLNFLSNYQFQTKIGFEIELQKWSVESLIAASKISDVCIIPSDPGDPRKSGASSNRLITSIALGLPTAAELLPSYEEFSKYFFNIRSNSLFEIMSNSSSYETKKLILSRHMIRGNDEKRFGIYNAGFLYMSDSSIPNKWKNYTYTSKFFEQLSMEDLANEFRDSLDEFSVQNNYGWWRLFQGKEPIETLKSKWGIKRTSETSGISVEDKPLLSVHTHWKTNDAVTNMFNKFILTYLEKVQSSVSKTKKFVLFLKN